MSKILLAGFIFSLIFLIFVIFLSPLFNIRDIELWQSGSCLDEGGLQRELGGKKIFLISADKLGNELKKKYACIETIDWKKVFPNKIRLKISVKGPVVRIEGSNFGLAENGLVVETQNFGSLPTLFLPGEIGANLGAIVTDAPVLVAAKIAASLAKSDFVPVNVRIIDAETIAVYNLQGVAVLFSAKNPPVTQIDSLQQVLAKAKIESAKIAKIDLRFDKPIIVYK